MMVKEQILKELELLPESRLSDVLAYLRSLNNSQKGSDSEKVWQAYLDSEREREEVYRRLANS
ncbi:DUF2281 domain-containing protein [Chroococcus sp. FPU101]|uniref:DUF2281 domain-containing protein n=1 Tax=Chroococcus sp. FPU101 TaxID=1974212 RepID=UPI001A8EF247|nr:DUF2281 domain-containing protein [Chroococcus sp. FPU101]GFE71686.1 hypothetical protein CFPU101_42960 [Chroococcus sp. FPU101]